MKLNNTKCECYLKYIFFILQMYSYAGFFWMSSKMMRSYTTTNLHWDTLTHLILDLNNSLCSFLSEIHFIMNEIMNTYIQFIFHQIKNWLCKKHKFLGKNICEHIKNILTIFTTRSSVLYISLKYWCHVIQNWQYTTIM